MSADNLETDNRVRLLHALRQEPGISKSTLTQRLRLGSGTVSVLVADLVAAGLVVSRGHAPSTGGRPAERLALNPDRPLMLGVDLGETDARFGVLNLQGELLRVDRAPLQRTEGVVDLEPILHRIAQIAGETPDISGVGIAVPGRIAKQTSQVIRASNLGWRALPLREKVEQATSLSTVVDRNTTAALLGEEWWGSTPAGDPFVFVTVGSGIGAAVKINGRVLHGTSDAAGEFGHIPIEPDGRMCRCGSRGCLETLASVPAVLAAYGEARRAAGLPATDDTTTVASLQAAAATDSLAASALSLAAKRLGHGLTTLASLFNPRVIVLGGELMDAEEAILPGIITTLAQRGAEAPGVDVEIVRSTFGDKASLIGAATLGFNVQLPALARPKSSVTSAPS